MPISVQARAFVDDVLAWLSHSDDARLMRAIRSPYSAIPHDAAAAYAALAPRIGPLFDALAGGRLALPVAERDAVLAFVERLRALSHNVPESDAATLREAIVTAFALEEGLEAQPQAGSELRLSLQESQSADPRAGIRARQQHFSASALNAFAECPRKWYYRYVCAAVEDPGSSASFYGTAFHLALEHFHEEFPRPGDADEALMRERIVAYVDRAFAQHRDDFDSAIEVELQLRRAQRTAQRYVDWLVAQSRRAPFTVIGRELPANLDLGGHAFVGFIDRLDRDDGTGNVSVIDYKTGAIAATAGEYLDKVRAFKDFQLPFYYWARTEQGDRVTRLALLPLKDAMLDVEPVVLEVVPGPTAQARRSEATVGTIGIDVLERARARMIDICTELTNGSIESFAVTTDPAACTYCAYKLACSQRPHAEREKFGR